MTDTVEIDSVAVKEIADTYGLDAEILERTLRHLVSGGYEVVEGIANGPGAKDLNNLLGKMKKRAGALRETLDEVPVMTSFHAELFYKYKHLYMLKNELDDLVSAIDTIKPKSKRGITADTLKQDMLINHLAIFWWRQTGNTPTFSTKRYTNERSSDFLDFLATVALMLGIDSDPLPDRFARLKQQNPIYKDLK